MRLTKFVELIEARPNYAHHIVLDGGERLIVVLDTNGNLWRYMNNSWDSINAVEAEAMCNVLWAAPLWANLVAISNELAVA